MKEKYEPSKRKPIKEVDAHKHYSGEASPYWEFMEHHGATQGDASAHLQEHVLGNQDVLAETENMHDRPLTELGRAQLEVIQDAWRFLSPQQRRVLYLCGYLGYTMEATAKRLGVKLATVQTQLSRARKKIVAECSSQGVIKKVKNVSI